jgi:hypothetical protein
MTWCVKNKKAIPLANMGFIQCFKSMDGRDCQASRPNTLVQLVYRRGVTKGFVYRKMKSTIHKPDEVTNYCDTCSIVSCEWRGAADSYYRIPTSDEHYYTPLNDMSFNCTAERKWLRKWCPILSPEIKHWEWKKKKKITCEGCESYNFREYEYDGPEVFEFDDDEPLMIQEYSCKRIGRQLPYDLVTPNWCPKLIVNVVPEPSMIRKLVV